MCLGDCRVVRPRTLGEVIRLLSSETGVALIAGGTDLVVKMKDGAARPRVLVAIDGLPELGTIEWRDGGCLWIGAGAAHAQIMASQAVREHAPLLVAACSTVGSPQIRNRGTIGGNVVTASPAGDTIPALMCLDAVVHVDGAGGPRTIPMERFLLGPGKTALAAGEVVTGFALPAAGAAGAAGGCGGVAGTRLRWAYRKLGQRKALSISIAGVAVTLGLAGEAIVRARVALGSVAPTVRRATELEHALIGPVPDDARLKDLAVLARESASPISDIRGSAAYRLAMVEALTYQALYEALNCEPQWQLPAAAGAGAGSGSEGQRRPPLDRAHDDVGECCGRCRDGAAPGGTIAIDAVLHGELATATGDHVGGERRLVLPAGATVARLWEHLGIGRDGYIVALVNGRRCFDDTVLNDGDRVSLMRPVGGG
jgi:CO/xanthine dehydrogenase FAD-binding subunit/sulfur carrier protein ThiS